MYNPTIRIYSGDYKYKPLDRYLLMRVGIPTSQPIKNAYKVQTNISPWAEVYNIHLAKHNALIHKTVPSRSKIAWH
jgi:hypothetical protein